MFHPLADRIRHLVEAVINPAWRVVTFFLLDLLGGLLTVRDELAPDWFGDWKGLAAIHLTWSIWLAFTFGGLFLLAVEGSFQVRRRIEGERDELRSTLNGFGLQRGVVVSFGSLSRTAGPTPSWQGFTLNLANVSENLIRYKVVDIGMEFDGNHLERSGAPVNDGAFISPRSDSSYIFESKPLPIPQMPFTATYWYTIEYDNVPPIKPRTTYRKIRATWLEGRMFDLIVEQDER